MPQLAIAAAAAAFGSLAPAGFAVLGMGGAQLGWFAGTAVGSVAFVPTCKRVSDAKEGAVDDDSQRSD